ncbi:hypothetical protein TIFTF001_033829 [Ficus carica]|uniref:Uncharacterized protein n=1 Tax=Ficus carica TaxID=3494 RepID=A0AA88E1G9_FICCA|nr:hypothetical protein TIFTF001_033829 [Ficus carica]
MDWLELLGNVLFLGQNHSFKGFPIPFHEEPDILLDLGAAGQVIQPRDMKLHVWWDPIYYSDVLQNSSIYGRGELNSGVVVFALALSTHDPPDQPRVEVVYGGFLALLGFLLGFCIVRGTQSDLPNEH